MCHCCDGVLVTLPGLTKPRRRSGLLEQPLQTHPGVELLHEAEAAGIWAEKQVGLRSSPLECLNEINGIKVKEQVALVEALSSFILPGDARIEDSNLYEVHKHNPDEDVHWDIIFHARERTGFNARQLKMFFGDCVPWNVQITYSQYVGEEKAWELVREQSFTCCCLNRPTAYLRDDSGALVGSVRDTYGCCGNSMLSPFYIFDADGAQVLDLRGKMSQDENSQRLVYNLTNANGDEVGSITRSLPKHNIIQQVTQADDIDNYNIDFNGVEKPEHKALVMALAIFMDFRYFNSTTRTTTSGGHQPGETEMSATLADANVS